MSGRKRYVVCKLTWYEEQYTWFRITNKLTRRELIKFLYKRRFNNILSHCSLTMNETTVTDGSLYCIFKDYYIVDPNTLVDEYNDYYDSKISHSWFSTCYLNYIQFRKDPIPRTGKKRRRGKCSRYCRHMGIKLTCSINMSPEYKEFYDPIYNYIHLGCFDWDPPPECYRKDRSWKKNYHCRKQWMIHQK